MGKDLLYWASKLLDLSRIGLEKRDIINKSGKNESLFLNHLQKLIDNKTTNADHMINKFSKNEDLMNYMINKVVAIQGDHPIKLKPETDTSIFLAHEIQNRYKIFYYDPKNLSIVNSKVIADGFFIEFNYSQKKFFKIFKKKKLDLIKCKFILVRQDPPFNLEYISTTYILDTIKDKVKIINDPIQLEMYLKNFILLSIKNLCKLIFYTKYDKIKTFFKKNNEVMLKPFQF